jgi:short-subunit dehydrogenase
VKLSGATVLLTGASGGIGHAIARELAGAGARLVLTGRRTALLEALAAETGGTALAVDLADPAALDALADAHGDCDVLVANAALPASGRLTTFSAEEIDRALRVNLHAPIRLAQACSARMTARGDGHLVFVSSLAGKAATQGSSIYNATKFGLRGFASAMRAELHDTGVGVSTIFPGFIRDAGMFAEAGVRLPRGVGTRTPAEVATATRRAIERNRGEVDVAPLGLRLGTTFGALAPDAAARLTRLMGADGVASGLESGQAAKR